MAITKIHAIKSTLGKALAYIENPDKTDGQMLVSGYNCEPQTASIDFEMTAVLAHKARNLQRKRSTNLAYHLIQSFSPEDAVTPEQAHELGKKLAFEYTGGKYEYGQCAVSLYPNHQYSYIPTSGENKRNSIQGDQLAAILGVEINPSTENTTLSRRIAAVERRMGIENAKNLGKVLLGMTSENMYTAADYDKAILSLGKKQIDLTNKISAMQEKRKEVAAVTKSLQICKTYKPVWMQYVELPMSQKSAFYSGHSTELQAYSSAAKNLEKEGIDQSVDLDKAIGFTEQLERKIEETKEQLRETNSEEKKAQQERKKVLDIQENHTIN